jgi:hypothetical protein
VKRLLIVAILVISTVPLYAQGQQPNVAKLKEDAQKVVSITTGDKAKIQTYCQIANLGEQMDEAVHEKDKKKFEELAQRINEGEKQLGPEQGCGPKFQRCSGDRLDIRSARRVL